LVSRGCPPPTLFAWGNACVGGQRRVTTREDLAKAVVFHRSDLHGFALGVQERGLAVTVVAGGFASEARLRAVVVIHPAGLGGRPLDGQRCDGSPVPLPEDLLDL